MRLKTEIELVEFENRVAAAFNNGQIRAPIHLYSNNEKNYWKSLMKFRRLTGFFVHGEVIISVF